MLRYNEVRIVVLSGESARFIADLNPGIIGVAGLGISTLLGLADYYVGSTISLSLFYLIPIALVAWYAGRRYGIATAIYSGLTLYWTNISTGAFGTQILLAHGAMASHLIIYLIVALLVARFRVLLNREREASRIDFLTGALNRRAFYEIANIEIERARRHNRPFTVTYFDLDDFKRVNDQLGHVVGDDVLRHVVTTVIQHLRTIDSIARLGGDEFVILLPEADSDAAHAVVDKMRKLVLEDMQAQNWPITLSIGVLICDQAPLSIDAMMRSADQLMYRVKNEGKNSIAYSNCRELGMEVQAP
ncbi:MAG: diguanylate cyclase [Gammaproteobacteria bacterium]|nr:diguanylate cyclase [Gammaproteobacteria bacterium]